MDPAAEEQIKLPDPSLDGLIPLEAAIKARRSFRRYSREALDLTEIAQLLWAAQGITSPLGYRSTPSAGALYPLEVFLLTGPGTDLMTGVYQYSAVGHFLTLKIQNDQRIALSKAALSQSAIHQAPVVLVFAAAYERITPKYGNRGQQYTFIEVGHAAQNVYLQAVVMGLGTVAIGAFRAAEVKKILNLEPDFDPLYIMPVGRV